MVSIFVQVGICAAAFSAAASHLLPSNGTPCATPCRKAEFRVHRRHVGGVYEQKMMGLQNNMYRLYITLDYHGILHLALHII